MLYRGLFISQLTAPKLASLVRACEMYCKVCSLREEISDKDYSTLPHPTHHIAADWIHSSLDHAEILQSILHTMVIFLQGEFYVLQPQESPSSLSIVCRTLCGLALFTSPKTYLEDLFLPFLS